jgi:hypothetical protein
MIRSGLIAAILLVGGPAVSADLPPYDKGQTAPPQHHWRRPSHHHRHEPPRRVTNLKAILNP